MIAAGAIIRAMAQHQRDAELDRLDALTPSELREVTAALARLPREAELDVGRLIDGLRRYNARRQSDAEPLLYALELMDLDELCRFRDDIVRTGDVALALASLDGRHALTASPVAGKRVQGHPSGARDPRKRGIARAQRAIRSPASPASTLDDALDAIEGIVAKPGRAARFIGGRAFDENGPIGGGADTRPFPPPWLAAALADPKEDSTCQ